MNKELRDSRKKSFQLFYTSTADLIDNFNDEEVGKVFRAIAEYEMYGVIPEFPDRSMNLITARFIQELDRFMTKFEETCKRNKANRNKKNNKIDGSLPLVTNGTDKDKEEEEDKEEDKDNDTRVATNGTNGNSLYSRSDNDTNSRKNSKTQELSADDKIYAEEFNRRFNSEKEITFGA